MCLYLKLFLYFSVVYDDCGEWFIFLEIIVGNSFEYFYDLWWFRMWLLIKEKDLNWR